MGSMFDEMKKVKKHLKQMESGTATKLEPQNSTPHRPENRLEKCPRCGQHVPYESLKKHLMRAHGVPESVSQSSATVTVAGHQVAKSKPGRNSSSAPLSKIVLPKNVKPNQLQSKQPHKQGKGKKHSLLGLDPKQCLSGYTEQVIQLPTGGTHTIFVRRTGPKPNQAIPTKANKEKKQSVLKAGTPKMPSNNSVTPSSQTTRLAPGSFNLARPDEFKEPDDWVPHGGEITLVKGGRLNTAFMGIDFGTAYTKASIGFGGDIFIVDWEGVKRGPEKFTLPGEFSVLSNGTCVLGRSPDAVRVASDLKLPFLEDHATKVTVIDATIFLALIMRYVRAWWFHRQSGLAHRHALEWNVNLGAPTTPWQDNRVRSKYERAARAAWLLSIGGDSIDLARAEIAYAASNATTSYGLPPIEIIPEFVAQIASYTRSPQRQPDLHLLVDVGAGTVDIVTFNVHRDDDSGEDRFPIFWATVSNLGTHYLMARRLSSFQNLEKEQWDDASFVPSASQLSQTAGVLVSEIKRVDAAHASDVTDAILSVVRITKQRRYRRSPNWASGVRVFLCGGGSSSEVFQHAINSAGRQSGTPLSHIKLPLPERLKATDLPHDQFHRVSVAFGLGMNFLNLGQIIPTANIKDDIAVPFSERAHFDWNDG